MQANPEKIQAFTIGNKTHDMRPVFNTESAVITYDDVKLLGDRYRLSTDFQSTYEKYIS